MDWQDVLLTHWHVKFLTVVLIYAAWIDGKLLKVPNKITFPLVLSGLLFNAIQGGWGSWNTGLAGGLLGMFVGLITLFWLFAIGGMGAGDVKLMAGIGAWVGPAMTWDVFIATTLIGAFMSVVMVWMRNDWKRHMTNFLVIVEEWKDIRKLGVSGLSDNADQRKPTMRLLPYGIPICFGAIAVFLYDGLLV